MTIQGQAPQLLERLKVYTAKQPKNSLFFLVRSLTATLYVAIRYRLHFPQTGIIGEKSDRWYERVRRGEGHPLSTRREIERVQMRASERVRYTME